jgi:hypothetical protein
LALDLAIAPTKENGGQRGVIVATKAVREDAELAACRSVELRTEAIPITGGEHSPKLECELMSTRQWARRIAHTLGAYAQFDGVPWAFSRTSFPKSIEMRLADEPGDVTAASVFVPSFVHMPVASR